MYAACHRTQIGAVACAAVLAPRICPSCPSVSSRCEEPMARHQYGIFTEGTRAHHHLEFVRLAIRCPMPTIAAALLAIRMANAEHRTNGGTDLVIGVRTGPVGAARAFRRSVPVRSFPGYATTDGPVLGAGDAARRVGLGARAHDRPGHRRGPRGWWRPGRRSRRSTSTCPGSSTTTPAT